MAANLVWLLRDWLCLTTKWFRLSIKNKKWL